MRVNGGSFRGVSCYIRCRADANWTKHTSTRIGHRAFLTANFFHLDWPEAGRPQFGSVNCDQTT
jgi:hypothetical protein